MNESQNQKKPNRVEQLTANEITNWEDLNLKGNVKSLLEYEIPTSEIDCLYETSILEYLGFQNLSLDSSINTVNGKSILGSDAFLFNQNGDAYEQNSFYNNSAQTRMQKQYNTFDRDGKLLEVIEYEISPYDHEKELKRNLVLNYNHQGKVVGGCVLKYYYKETRNCFDFIYSGTNITTTNVEVDLETGDTVHTSSYLIDKNGAYLGVDPNEINTFDKKGNLLKNVSWHPHLKVHTSTTLYNYDNNDNMIQKTFYDRDHVVVANESFTYDEDGNLIMKIDYDESSISTETFLPNGKILQNQYFNFYDTIVQFGSEKYFYDDFRNLTKQELMSDEKTITYHYKYNFDHQNNWIQRERYLNDSLTWLERRKINYF